MCFFPFTALAATNAVLEVSDWLCEAERVLMARLRASTRKLLQINLSGSAYSYICALAVFLLELSLKENPIPLN
jgi:hypothetical protein